MKVTMEISVSFPETEDTSEVEVSLGADEVVTIRLKRHEFNMVGTAFIRLEDLKTAIAEFEKRLGE